MEGRGQAVHSRFKVIMISIAVVGVLGTIIPNLADPALQVREKAVICISLGVFIPLVTAAVYKVGTMLMKEK
ncbi:hypothetical protein [Paenibacillus sp. JSM ZJ436]|uniref:hypothetical protein n=1 Tax=Paenibacillus sp. JSM ZJ436 TaxID=3376190 RepID=UPI0037C93816